MCPSPVRKPYPSDVSDEEWSLVVPYLTLMTEVAPQRDHSLRELFNALRYVIRYGIAWRAMPNDFPPWAAVYQQSQRWLAAGCFETPSSCRLKPPLIFHLIRCRTKEAQSWRLVYE